MSCRRMANCLNFSAILALCCLQALAELQEYGPFQEGLSETLTCSGTASAGKRSIYWRKIFPNGTYVQVAKCHEENQHHQCEANSPEYKITFSPTNGGFITNLTLPMSIIERNAAIKCSLFDYTNDSSRFIRSWDFSKTYHPADYPVCRAARLDVRKISFNCSVQNIYPKFICEMFEIHGDKESKVDATEIKYSPPSIDSRGYISGACYVVRQVCQSGTYKYRAKIYPDPTLRDVVNAVRERETETVVISSEPTVEVKQESCSASNKALVFTCTVYWLQKKPTFKWHVDNELVRESNSRFIDLNECYQFVSKIELPETISHNGRQIQCTANNGIRTYSSENKTIRQIWPTPQPPHFAKDGNSILGGSINPAEGEQIDTFICKVADEAKNVTQIRVTCQLGAETLINTEHYGASISFDINYTIARTHVCCQCSVQYTTDCMLSTNLTIRLKPSPNWQYFDTTKVIVVTVAGFVLLILLIFLIGTLLFLKNHWSEMYTYVYSKLYASSGLKTGDKDTGLYSHVREFIRHVSSVGTDSPSDFNTEAQNFTSIGTHHTANNNNSRLSSDYSHSSCEDLACVPPPLPPRETSVTITSVTHNRHTSHTANNPTCNLNVTDDGYLVPMSITSDQRFEMETVTSYRNNERFTFKPRQPERVVAAEYLQLVPDLPPREPLLVGKLMDGQRPFRHTFEFIEEDPPIPPRQPFPAAVRCSRKESATSHSRIPSRMNWPPIESATSHSRIPSRMNLPPIESATSHSRIPSRMNWPPIESATSHTRIPSRMNWSHMST